MTIKACLAFEEFILLLLKLLFTLIIFLQWYDHQFTDFKTLRYCDEGYRVCQKQRLYEKSKNLLIPLWIVFPPIYAVNK